MFSLSIHLPFGGERFTKHHVTVTAWCVAILAFCLAGLDSVAAAGEDRPPPLTRIEDIRRLSRDEASKGLPVEISGVVVWQWPDHFVLHDGGQGIWVALDVACERGIWKGGETATKNHEVGVRLRIEGVTDGGGYAPVILPVRSTVLGNGPSPTAWRIPVDRMLAGSEDAQRVVLEGVIQDVVRADQDLRYPGQEMPRSGQRLTDTAGSSAHFAYLLSDGQLCRLLPGEGVALDPAKLVDARVQVRGVLVQDYNYRSEPTGVKLLIADAGDIEIIKPPPADPYSVAKVPVSSLLPFSVDAEPWHRKVTEGTVVFSLPGEFFFLQDGASSVRVETKSHEAQVGQRVEVAGFVDMSRKFASLKNASVRSLGPASLPAPVDVKASHLLSRIAGSSWGTNVTEDFSGKIVRLTGILRRIDWKSPYVPGAFLMDQSGYLFYAHMPLETAISPELKKAWTEGAEMELTGISELKFAESPNLDGFHQPSGFRLWLASPRDVKILRQPPWWTAGRLWIAFAAAAALLAITLIWNFSLRTILQRRTRRLEEVMRVHRNTELEYKGARRERQRLAGDLHDGMQQMLVGAAYRLEAASAEMGEVPPAVQNQIRAARRAMLRTQEGLREFIWGLNHVEKDIDSFDCLVRHAVKSVEYWPEDGVSVESTGTPFPLSRHVKGTLLLLVQEAAGNAFKHGEAKRVFVTLHYGGSSLEITVKDDGTGFEKACVPGPAQGHFGLESMANRMHWLGGSITIKSKTGIGCTVHCQMPKTKALLEEDSSASTQIPREGDGGSTQILR